MYKKPMDKAMKGKKTPPKPMTKMAKGGYVKGKGMACGGMTKRGKK